MNCFEVIKYTRMWEPDRVFYCASKEAFTCLISVASAAASTSAGSPGASTSAVESGGSGRRASMPRLPDLNAPFPVRLRRRNFRSSLYSAPMNPSRRRKHRKAYLSLSVSFSLCRLSPLHDAGGRHVRCETTRKGEKARSQKPPFKKDGGPPEGRPPG